MKYYKQQAGYLLIQTLIFGFIAVVVVLGLMSYATSTLKLGRHAILSEQAFQIAEAGLEYYRWHLAHAPTDFTNGTGQPGPYVKNFTNASGTVIGTFSLDITPPGVGSTLLTIESTGRVSADANVSRTIVAKLSIPSFANYAVITDAAMRFGRGTEVFGPIHSNDGLRFDGLAHNLVTSAVTNYNDPDHSGNNEFGVHTHVNAPPSSGTNDTFRSLEAPPATVPARTDVFIAGRSFPAPVVNFSVITDDLTNMEIQAQSGGFYRAGSTSQGYRVVLKTNDTFDLYRVTSLMSPPSACTNVQSQTGWSSWSVNASTLLGTYAFPANGLIFLEDHVWVEGTINSARLTIVAAQVPDLGASSRKSLVFNNNILYTNYDGTDALALIGQNNVNAGLFSANTLRVDGALVAQYGRVGRYYYEADCTPNHTKSSLTLYGTIVTALRYGFAYGSAPVSSGYSLRTLIYDTHLLYTPPPFFPETDPFYDVIYWKEE